MAIEFTASEQAHFVILDGQVDLALADELKQNIFSYIDSHADLMHLCVDLGQVSYIDSSGIGVLVVLFSRLKKSGKRFSICGISPEIKPVFNTTMLDKFFPIFASRADVS